MNGDLSLPGGVAQQAQLEQVMAQNQKAMLDARRATAVNLAVQYAHGRDELGTANLLDLAHKIAHFLDTGQVPAEAKRS